MSEQELAAAGELGASATLTVVSQAFLVDRIHRINVPYMFPILLRNFG